MADVCPTCQRPFTRSSGQNRYLWGVLYKCIADETGHSSEECHEFMKARFLPRRFIVINGEEIQISKSTASLTVPEFSQYVDRVSAFAQQELGIEIPVRGAEQGYF